MTESEPVRWSSPANAWATVAQTIALFIPLLSVLEVYQPVALEAISVAVADIWQWLILITAVASIAASIAMRFAIGNGTRMRAVARFEQIATAGLSGCLGLLWWALVHEYGFAANPLTQLLVGGLAIAALARVAQIEWDLWKYRRALRGGQIAHVEALAQPKET